MLQNYCISDKVVDGRAGVRNLAYRVFPGIKEVKEIINKDTLYISTTEDVMKLYGTEQYAITVDALDYIGRIFDNDHLIEIFILKRQICSFEFINKDVLIASFENEEALEIAKKVDLMGGYFSADFHSEVTITVAKTMVSKRVMQSINECVPIVSRDWVDDSFNEKKLMDMSRYLLPRFAGMTITSTDLTFEEANELSTIVKKNGGTWSDSLSDKSTSLLSEFLSLSKKTICALKYSVPIIRPIWIKECSICLVEMSKYALNWWIFLDNKFMIYKIGGIQS
jgi:hypothetical protein